jgi:hypothetical protein
MDRPQAGSAQEALEGFLGHWSGTTRWEATAWAPARTAAADIVFARAAAGLAMTMSYRHQEPDGAKTEGIGVFTTDRTHADTLWYHVNSPGQPAESPVRASWQDGTLTIERRSARGVARHTLRLEQDRLIHAAGLRLGAAREFSPVLTTVCRRIADAAAVPA